MAQEKKHCSPVITCGLVSVSMDDGSTSIDLLVNAFKRLFTGKKSAKRAERAKSTAAKQGTLAAK